MQRRRNSDVIVETLELEGKRVIDVGCGDGHLSRLLAKNGAQVLGVECSPRQLAKARAAEPMSGVEIVDGVGQNLPADDESADIVVFFNSLHHVPADFMQAALAEARRVLKPGGLVYVSEPIADGLFFQTCKPVDDETQVRALAQEAVQGAPGLDGIDEITYLHTISMRDYDAFRDRIISANSEREAKFAAIDGAMRALFAANGRANAEGGMDFDQPMRVNVLRKSDA